MITREHRVSKPVDRYIIPKECMPRVRINQKKKRPAKKANYVFIPPTLKFVYPLSVYEVHGKMYLKEKGDRMVLDTCNTINQISICSGIDISNKDDQRVITMTFENVLKEYTSPPCAEIIDKLKHSDNSDYNEWADIIATYSENYENMLRTRNNNEFYAPGYTEEELKALEAESDKFEEKVFQTEPCIIFKHSIKNNCLYIQQMEMNEKYIEKLGYSLDSFAAQTLREGVPQLTPNDSVGYESTQNEKAFFKYFFLVHEKPIELPETAVDMIVKGGYVKKMNFKFRFLMSFRERFCSLSTLVTISDVKTDVKKIYPDHECLINKEFLEKMIDREKQAQDFLFDKYQVDAPLPYTEFMKTCRIRELDMKTEENEDKEINRGF